MRSRLRFRRRSSASALGVVVGVVAGAVVATWSTAFAGPSTVQAPAIFDVTHLPPLLTVAGEPIELAYDVHCASGDLETADAGCDARGTVFLRELGDSGPFEALPLETRARDGGRQLAVAVPDAPGPRTRGIEYYAMLEAHTLGRRLTLPAGGAAAPHVSRPLLRSVTVELGDHAFGSMRRGGARIAFASWGDRSGQAGLEKGRSIGPIGASAFDVDRRGNVFLLDQVHRRVFRWDERSTAATQVPVSVDGTLADMAVAEDGSLLVLETAAESGRNPVVRRFDDGGRELEAVETPERTASQIRVDARGPVILSRPSHHWTPVFVDGVPATQAEQLERGRPSLRFDGGRDVLVFRHADETRLALVTGGNLTRSWRVTSGTPVAEVQLAEPWGERVVVVVRVYEDARDEFVVLVLDRNGLVERFVVESAEWAEASALGRFRLVGSSLYRLGSSPAGAFVDRFDLEVR